MAPASLTIDVGATTTVYAYDVHPSDLEVEFWISGPIHVEGKCTSQASTDGYPVHSKFTAEGCSPGTATVKLLASSDNAELDSTTITVRAATPPSNKPPTISGLASISYKEDRKDSVTKYTAADPDEGDKVTLTLKSGGDNDLFSIGSTSGTLSFVSFPDYEKPQDVGKDNVYNITVVATDDGSPNKSAHKAVTVTVTNVNESPTISGSTSVSYEENLTDSVATYTATDPEKDKITWTLKSGGDNGRFSIDASGALSFASSPDYEKPQDVGKNNVYNITVKATDDGSPKKSAEKAMTVTVTDVKPPGKLGAPTVTSGGQSSLNVSWSAPSNTGPPITGYGVQYRKGSSGSFTNASHSGTGTTATISGLDAGTSYQVQVRATNDEGNGAWSNSGSGSTAPSDTPTPAPTSTPTPSAWLEPDPDTVNFRTDGLWRAFTVRSNVPVKVVVNTSNQNLRLGERSGGICPGDALNRSIQRSNGQMVYLLSCLTGTGTVELRHGTTVLKTYSFTINPLCTIEDLNPMALPYDGTLTHPGDWGNPCQYLRFNIADPTVGHVIIDLNGAGLDTMLTLYEGGSLTSMTRLAYNDDNPEVTTVASRIGRKLPPGSYIVKAELKRPADATSSKALTLTLNSKKLIPHGGDHQADHTAAYTIGPMPTATPPAGLPDPGPIISKAITDGMAEWNSKAGGTTGTWPDVKFCPHPCGRNADGFVIDVRVEASRSACKTTIACAKIRKTAATGGNGRHIVSSSVVIEQPAIEVNRNTGLLTSWWWTDNPHLDGWEVTLASGDKYTYWYLPSTMLHELGHVLGLDDLYNITGRPFRGSSLMDSPGTRSSIPTFDVNYLHQVYRQHGGERHGP